MLYTCYELIRPDVALELAWRNGYYDFFMPYIIQYMRHTHEKIKTLETKAISKEADKEPESSAAEVAAASMLYGNQLMLGDGPALLANEPYNPMGGGGYDYGGYGGTGYGAGGAGYGQGYGQPGYGQYGAGGGW